MVDSASYVYVLQYACELSRAETENRDARANKAKLAEEQRLWTETEAAPHNEAPEAPPEPAHDPLVGVVEPQKRKTVVRRTSSGTAIRKTSKESKEE